MRKRTRIFTPKYEYYLEMNFRDAETGRKLGGWYKTIEEAKAAAEKVLQYIFYEPKTYAPLPSIFKE